MARQAKLDASVRGSARMTLRLTKRGLTALQTLIDDRKDGRSYLCVPVRAIIEDALVASAEKASSGRKASIHRVGS